MRPYTRLVHSFFLPVGLASSLLRAKANSGKMQAQQKQLREQVLQSHGDNGERGADLHVLFEVGVNDLRKCERVLNSAQGLGQARST